MAAPVISPELQWLDPNGKPYVSGTITTYVIGTATPKATWADPGLTALNPNPVRLDGAGRSLMWGDGDYRLVLRDAANNLIFDQPATTIVLGSPGPGRLGADARGRVGHVLGVDALVIAIEANNRAAADSAEQSARIAGDNALETAITTEATTRADADNTLSTEIGGINTALDALIAPGHSFRFGTGTSDSAGNFSVIYSAAFPTGTASVVCTATDPLYYVGAVANATGFSGQTSYPGGPAGPVVFFYIAVGN